MEPCPALITCVLASDQLFAAQLFEVETLRDGKPTIRGAVDYDQHNGVPVLRGFHSTGIARDGKNTTASLRPPPAPTSSRSQRTIHLPGRRGPQYTNRPPWALFAGIHGIGEVVLAAARLRGGFTGCGRGHQFFTYARATARPTRSRQFPTRELISIPSPPMIVIARRTGPKLAQGFFTPTITQKEIEIMHKRFPIVLVTSLVVAAASGAVRAGAGRRPPSRGLCPAL